MNYYNPYMYNLPYLQQQMPQQPQPQPQMMPTIQANIIQADEDTVNRYSVGNGQSQMFISKDEDIIWVKSGTANGNETTVYKKQAAPKKEDIQYVTMEMLENAVSDAVQKALGKEQT